MKIICFTWYWYEKEKNRSAFALSLVIGLWDLSIFLSQDTVYIPRPRHWCFFDSISCSDEQLPSNHCKLQVAAMLA